MALDRIGGRSTVRFVPAGDSGSYNVGTLVPGLYRINTDTTQNIAASNFFIQTAEGFRFGAPLRGGEGFLSVPIQANIVNVTAGTFPLPITLERVSDYETLSAPTASVVDYLPASLAFTVSLPSGARGFNVFWPDGTSACVSGSAASIAVPSGLLPDPPNVTGLQIAVAARDVNGVTGRTESRTLTSTYPRIAAPASFSVNYFAVASLSYTISGSTVNGYGIGFNANPAFISAASAASINIAAQNFNFLSPVTARVWARDSASQAGNVASFNLGQFPWVEYLSSTTFTPPPNASLANVYVVGGGGGCAGTPTPAFGPSSAGGAGGGRVQVTTNVPITAPVSIVVGGGGSGTTGTTSSFGPVSAVGGSGVASQSAPGGPSGSGNAGGSGANGGGGGGGQGSVGAASTPTASGNGGSGYLTHFTTPVAGGGGGGRAGGGTAGVGQDGGGNGAVAAVSSGATGTNGAGNRGGGAGGGAIAPPGPYGVGTTSGGSGRVAVRVIFN